MYDRQPAVSFYKGGTVWANSVELSKIKTKQPSNYLMWKSWAENFCINKKIYLYYFEV
jgi:hypothetical protein